MVLDGRNAYLTDGVEQALGRKPRTSQISRARSPPTAARPWVDHPLVFWKVDDIEIAHEALVVRGATALGEVADGSLAELGTAEVTNGNPSTGIVDVPGGRLAVVRAKDGTLIGLTQAVA